MKKLYIIIILVLGACTSSKKAITKEDSLKMEAKKFSLDIVKAYFAQDCDYVFNALSDEILVMDGDGIFKKKGKEKKSCRSTKNAIKDKQKTFKDYLKTYKVLLLTKEELLKKFKAKLPAYYITKSSDYFFIGWELKEGKTKADNFIWDDMFVFMARKENGIWKIKGISG
ncbi:hypothetical protein [Tenacibaculum amylolyticum]|uniref:hypothetical protein n=1 Tax=Tenacibaculum amylolyticum TaxID=104269 RepID=UPI003893CA43